MAASRETETICTPAAGSMPAALSSSSTPRVAPAVIGSGGSRGRELRVDPRLDRSAHLLLEPAVEAAAADLLEPLLLDLATVAQLQELVDGDPGRAGIVWLADLVDR